MNKIGKGGKGIEKKKIQTQRTKERLMKKEK